MIKCAVIVAGGSGTRMGAHMPKQFLPLAGLPVIVHTLRAFQQCGLAQLVLVLPAQQLEFCQALFEQYEVATQAQLVVGGTTRSDSVWNGLQAIAHPQAVVAVHDGVRPLVTPELIQLSFTVAATHGSAVACVPCKDSVRQVQGQHSTALPRQQLRLMQTPQTFQASLLTQAFLRFPDADASDEATLVELAGHQPMLIDGAYSNLKITTPEDLVLAEALMAQGY